MSQPGTGEQEGGELVLPAFGFIERERVLAQDELFAVVRDKFPVTPGHTLIIPKRAVIRFRELTEGGRSRLMKWVSWTQDSKPAQWCKPATKSSNTCPGSAP